MAERLRTYQDDDYPGAVALFDDAYAGLDTEYGSREDLAAVRRACPEGQIVVESEGAIVGLILSLPCRYADFTRPQPMADIYDPARLPDHVRGADSLFALEILVRRDHHRRGLGRRMNAAVAAHLVRANLRAFIGVSRVTGYAPYRATLPIEAYLAAVVAGTLRDPSLSFNIANGMLPTVPVPGYFPADTASVGHGALVVQPNPSWRAEAG